MLFIRILETGATVNPMYKAAAVVPMSAAISNPPQSFGNTIVTDGVKPWGFGSVPVRAYATDSRAHLRSGEAQKYMG